jgi:hypothetical protein
MKGYLSLKVFFGCTAYSTKSSKSYPSVPLRDGPFNYQGRGIWFFSKNIF